jgi:hypothetical protein
MTSGEKICSFYNKLVRKLDSFAYNAGTLSEARDLMVSQQKHPDDTK